MASQSKVRTEPLILRPLTLEDAPVMTRSIWTASRTSTSNPGRDRAKLDTNYQGFGRFLTGSSGEYLFGTIKPVPYARRTPHIHFARKRNRERKWTTQCYVKGEPRNQNGRVCAGISSARERDLVSVAFEPVNSSRVGELTARFDIVTGFTPEI